MAEPNSINETIEKLGAFIQGVIDKSAVMAILPKLFFINKCSNLSNKAPKYIEPIFFIAKRKSNF